MSRVHFSIGPVDAGLARTWLENSTGIVVAARRHRRELSVDLEDPLLDLCESYLSLWFLAAEGASTFHWEGDADAEHVRRLVEQWLLLARLTDEDLQRMGCHWAPEETHPFYDALLAGCVAALEADASTRFIASLLVAKPPGTPRRAV